MKINIVYKEENEWYIGLLQEYPDYESQGKTLDELNKNLLDIYHDIQQRLVSGVKPSKVLKLSILKENIFSSVATADVMWAETINQACPTVCQKTDYKMQISARGAWVSHPIQVRDMGNMTLSN